MTKVLGDKLSIQGRNGYYVYICHPEESISVVKCRDTTEQLTTQEPDTYHRVLYNFSAQMEGDMTVAEAEVVLVVEKKSRDELYKNRSTDSQ